MWSGGIKVNRVKNFDLELFSKAVLRNNTAKDKEKPIYHIKNEEYYLQPLSIYSYKAEYYHHSQSH
jgi:hypothetical protein